MNAYLTDDQASYETVAHKLRHARTERGLSRPQVERALGLGTGTLRRWETGQHRISLIALVLLADHFALPIDHFTDDMLEKD